MNIVNLDLEDRRSSSYQYQVLGVLRADQCLIKRPAHAFPYPFQVDSLPTIPPLPEVKTIEDAGKDLQEGIPAETETWLEMDFQRNALMVEKLGLVLQDWTETLNTIKCLSRVQILEDIRKASIQMMMCTEPSRRIALVKGIVKEVRTYNGITKKGYAL